MHISHDDKGCLCHHFISQTLLDSVSRLAAKGHRKFCRKCPTDHDRRQLFIVLSFIEVKQPNLLELCRPRRHINSVNFVRIAQGASPLGTIILVVVQTQTVQNNSQRNVFLVHIMSRFAWRHLYVRTYVRRTYERYMHQLRSLTLVTYNVTRVTVCQIDLLLLLLNTFM